jgi:tetratricopeptide (TPR) repeat protein
MKVAVYTIALNEEKFVKRFMASVKNEADLVIVADTGSTDRTVELLREEGAHVEVISVKPWRFDIARNASLHIVPADVDVCVCIDLDEVLLPGWRVALERAWTAGTTRLRYQYTWSFNEDGTPGISFWYDKIHARRGYKWVLPVHEVLCCDSQMSEIQAWTDELKLEHHPDQSKSRGSYLPLLELAHKERPNDDRTAHYLGREYMFYGRYDDAVAQLQKHLEMPSARWDAERCASMRFIARSLTSLGRVQDAEQWALRACAECPGDREPWLELGKVLQIKQDWNGLRFAMSRLFEIKERPKSYICEPNAWNHEPYDLMSLASWYVGLKDEALKCGREALALAPSDERLKNNVLLMEQLCGTTTE